MEFRDDFAVYLRTVGRQLRNEFNESPRCGDADTYDHTRKVPNKGNHDGEGRRNGAVGNFQRNNRNIRRAVNRDAVAEIDAPSMDYRDGDWGNSDYLGDLPSSVKFAENENNFPAIEIEFGDIDVWNTDTAVANYRVRRSAADDYRDAGRRVDYDAFMVFSKTN